MTEQLTAADHALFDAVFTSCDLDVIQGLVTDDFEFYHDRWGRIATSADQFVEGTRALCAQREVGTDYASRREPIEESVEVFLLGEYGAIHSGEHRFYRIAPGEADELVETGRFTHVWERDGERWRLARVLSYDHVMAH